MDNTQYPEKYWGYYFKSKFEENCNMFAEFEIDTSLSRKLYDEKYGKTILFKDGYELDISIDKKQLLQYLKNYMSKIFYGSQYFINTRPKKGTRNIVIVVSVMQNDNAEFKTI